MPQARSEMRGSQAFTSVMTGIEDRRHYEIDIHRISLSPCARVVPQPFQADMAQTGSQPGKAIVTPYFGQFFTNPQAVSRRRRKRSSSRPCDFMLRGTCCTACARCRHCPHSPTLAAGFKLAGQTTGQQPPAPCSNHVRCPTNMLEMNNRTRN